MSAGASESSSQTSTKDLTPAELMALRGPMLQGLGGLLGLDPDALMASAAAQKPNKSATKFTDTGMRIGDDALGGIPGWTGPFAADMSSGESQVYSNLLSQSGGGGPLGDARQNLLLQTLRGDYLPGQPMANPFLDSAIQSAQRTTKEGLMEALGRTLPGRFTQAGQFVQPGGSSPFDRAAGIATRGAADAMGDIASQMSFGAYEGERGRQNQAIQLSQAEVESTIKTLQASALPRLIEDLGLERAQAEFRSKVDALLKALATMAGVPMVNLGQFGSSSSSSFSFGLPMGG